MSRCSRQLTSIAGSTRGGQEADQRLLQDWKCEIVRTCCVNSPVAREARRRQTASTCSGVRRRRVPRHHRHPKWRRRKSPSKGRSYVAVEGGHPTAGRGKYDIKAFHLHIAASPVKSSTIGVGFFLLCFFFYLNISDFMIVLDSVLGGNKQKKRKDSLTSTLM